MQLKQKKIGTAENDVFRLIQNVPYFKILFKSSKYGKREYKFIQTDAVIHDLSSQTGN